MPKNGGKFEITWTQRLSEKIWEIACRKLEVKV